MESQIKHTKWYWFFPFVGLILFKRICEWTVEDDDPGILLERMIISIMFIYFIINTLSIIGLYILLTSKAL